MSTTLVRPPQRKRELMERAVIRFCGDSGDGMQITGSQFTNTVALYGNDLATLPDFPAEIRAPAGTLPGVSGFQVHFSSNDVYTPGDSVDALIAMNPAALKMNIADLKPNGILIVNLNDFGETDLRKAQMTANPLEDHSLDGYRLFPVELTKLHPRGPERSGPRQQERRSLQEFLRAGHVLLALQPLDGYHAALDRRQIQKQAAAGRRPIAPPCRRAIAIAKPPKRFRSATKFRPRNSPRRLSQHQRQYGAGHGFRRRFAKGRHSAFSRLVSDHARVRHFARAFGLQGFRRDHVSGRGRNCRHHFGDRRGLCRRDRHHHHFRSRHGAENRSDGPRRCRRVAAGDLRYSARRPFHRACRRKPSRPTCCRRSIGRNSEAPIPVLAPCHARRLLLDRA